MEKQKLTLVWQGITVDVGYVPEYSPGFTKTYGWRLAHLEIKRRDKGPLPITGTGYKSHFTNAADIEAMDGAEGYVRAWLDERGKTAKWKAQAAQERQLKLF